MKNANLCSRNTAKKAVSLLLITLMVLGLIPVTAKPVEAASYPTAHDIMLGGKRLDQHMPSGCSYNELTGVLTLDHYTSSDFYDRLAVGGGYTELKIEVKGNSYIKSSSVAIQADNCDLTIRGSGDLILDSNVNKNGGDPAIVAGIVARNVRLEGSLPLSITVTNTDSGKKGYCSGIIASGNVTVTDSSFISHNCYCVHYHTGSTPDTGIKAGGKIDISTTHDLYFRFVHYGHFEDRFALHAPSISFINCPSLNVWSGNLTSLSGWSPEYYTAEEKLDGSEWLTQFIPAPRYYYSVAGNNRYETAVAIAQRCYEYWPPSGEVIIVTGQKFPDALAANAYAGVADAPLLLSGISSLNIATKNLLQNDWGGTISKVTVIGGEFGPGFYNDLASLGFSESNGNLQKIAGADRYLTAEAVTDATLKLAASKSISVTAVAVATGQNPYDALSFSPWAYNHHIPILLVKNGKASESTKAKIASFPYVFLLGSEEVCSESNLKPGQPHQRLAGSNRYETSIKIAQFFVEMTGGGSYDCMGFADGTAAHFPDALAGGMLQGQLNAPIILTSETSSAPENVKPFIDSTLSGIKSRGKHFYFLGWAASGKSSEYDTLVKWLEAVG